MEPQVIEKTREMPMVSAHFLCFHRVDEPVFILIISKEEIQKLSNRETFWWIDNNLLVVSSTYYTFSSPIKEEACFLEGITSITIAHPEDIHYSGTNNSIRYTGIMAEKRRLAS